MKSLEVLQSEFRQTVATLALVPLPNVNQVIAEGRAMADQIDMGQSRFLDKFGCSSEAEYKTQCVKDGRIMYHAHIGMNDAQATVAALRQLDSVAKANDFRIDRAGFALDRRMGLPAERRDAQPAETGPMLANHVDWDQLAQCADIQPHMGDFMIGQPASVANTVHALRAGCTTIGNLSQFFTFEAPGWRDTTFTTTETVKAIGILGKLRDRGTLLHSYLEDGYGALFEDCATVAGWAYMEKYIVEELLGAKLSHCIGGLTSDPIKRAGWVFALDKIHAGECIGSMIYGDTISFTTDFNNNRGVVAEYLLWDILAQMHCPTGHAVLPLPVTEAIRIPSADEISEAQCLGRRIEQSAKRMLPHVDFTAAHAFAESVCTDGKQIFDNALAGLLDCGVDIRDPLQMLYVLKKMGPTAFETLFSTSQDNRFATDMFTLSRRVIDDHRSLFTSDENRALLKNRRLLLASSDVHEHAIGALAELLSEAGAEVVNLGAEQSTDQLMEAIRKNPVDALLISTHNGMALEYAQQLKSAMDDEKLHLPVVIGGVLNQKVDDHELPVPVEKELAALGFHPTISLPNLPYLLTSQADGKLQKN
ncbi:MAG: methylmalonyl-CoA mutase cobalamin-binding subunit [Polaribacter sp.]|jgi:methylmalonyl-CoA mutase cobalamin-binding subunit